MSDIGNIRAVREWSRRYFYTKEDINYFVTKLNEGYKGYALTFVGPQNKKVVVNPGNYEFTLNSDGWYRYIFFFTLGQEITIEVEDGETITYQLDEYNDTINLSPYVIATEQMTSIYQPSGYITESGHYHGGLVNAFNRNDGDYWDNWIQKDGTSNQWLCYEFPEPKTVYKVTIMLTPFHYANGVDNIMRPEHFAIQASNDGENWINIYEANNVIPNDINSLTFYISDPKPYIYYRYWVYTSTIEYVSSWYDNVLTAVKEIYYYTVDQEIFNYILATPQMTSNTEPYGEVISNNLGNAWYVFTQNENKGGWNSSTSFNNGLLWIGYKFTSPKCIKRLEVWHKSNCKTFKFQGSNDGENWIDLQSCTFRHSENNYYQPFNINNSNKYLYYRLLATEVYTNTSYIGFNRIDMLEVA